MITYTLDAQDIIVAVGEAWDAFARANDGEALLAERVKGRPLFDFVQGSEVVQLYHALFRKARASQRPLSFTFRCDAPSCQRRMSFDVNPLPDGGLQVRTELLDEAARRPVRLLDPHVPRDDTFAVLCAICSDVKSEDGQWRRLEEESERRGWLEAETVPRLSHSYCPRCLEEQLQLAGLAG